MWKQAFLLFMAVSYYAFRQPDAELVLEKSAVMRYTNISSDTAIFLFLSGRKSAIINLIPSR